ncbi:hypothetical protein ACQY0O_007627 [Thecaphora frezii]
MSASSLNAPLSAMVPPAPALNVLILGAGGREHAIAHHLLRSNRVEHVYCAPGNGGTATLGARCSNLDSPKASGDFSEIAAWAVQNQINLCIPGPEQPLVDGAELAFRKVGIPVFGPSPLAAQMEGSKTFAKAFMDKYNIPTAAFQSFNASQVDECLAYIQKLGGAQQVVLKASGLAAGKGVLLPESDEEARQGVEDILVKKVFGDAGSSLLIEQRLVGPELSVLAFSDGYTITALPGCQDHKRIGEGDTGPNTGGMGAYCPAPEGLVDNLPTKIRNEVLVPTIDGMRKEGFPFVGLLFVGLMLTADGPKVLEYNVRFGDPETEAVLELLDESKTSLADIIMACVERRLDSVQPVIRPEHAVSIVLASPGYPGKYPTGLPITIGQLPPNVTVYHAGTKLDASGQLVTAGGRVIAISAFGKTLQEAVELAYKGVDAVQFEGKTFRRDIAHRALKPAAGSSQAGGLTYAAAGVDIDAGNELVEVIKPLAKSTKRPGCDASLGGFGGTFDLKAIGMRDPILISGTDGVGTKLRVALDMGKHDTVGIDLVAMSVNDLLVQGALPFYFLDYFACSKLTVSIASAVIGGIAEGCRQANCGLIGGETAEMPGMYLGDEYDLAGFAVGAVERDALLPRLEQMEVGDVLVGLHSSGVHSNGFSLVRKVVERSGKSLTDACPFATETGAKTLGEALLAPTRIYVAALTELFQKDAATQGVIALSHITGGGFTDNIPRSLPKGLGAEVDLTSWKRPQLFEWLQQTGRVEPEEMARTFNNGIGMVLIVKKDKVEHVVETLKRSGEKPVVMGQVTDKEGVSYKGMESWRF